MSKQRQQSMEEDNRDIFDKALDYAPLAGTIIGGALMNRVARGRRPPNMSQKEWRQFLREDRGGRYGATAAGAGGGFLAGSGVAGWSPSGGHSERWLRQHRRK